MIATEQLELFTFEETIKKAPEREITSVDFNIPRGLRYSLECVEGWVKGYCLTWGNGRGSRLVLPREVMVFVDPETLADVIYFPAIDTVYGFGPHIWESKTRYNNLIFHFANVGDYVWVQKILNPNWDSKTWRRAEKKVKN